MKFSIIVIGYNQQDVICGAIESALGQSYQDLEVIYVDDASTDDSIARIEQRFSDCRLHIIRSNINQGSSVARLRGIKAATGDWCLLVDGDDSLCLNACETLYKTISERDKEIDIIGFGANIVCSEAVSKSAERWMKSEAVEPLLGAHNAEELLLVQYGTREKSWILWNKCFNIAVLRAVEASAKYEIFFRLTDYYLCFLACCEGHNYFGIPDQLYNYSYGPGISLRSLELDGVIRYMTGHKATVLLTEYAEKQGVLGKYKDCFEAVEQESFFFSIDRINKLPETDQSEGLKALIDTFGPKKMLEMLIKEKNLSKEIEYQAQQIQQLQGFRFWIKDRIRTKHPGIYSILKSVYSMRRLYLKRDF